jgi:hypothetical protein
LESRPHPEQGFRSCFGLFRLGKVYGKERLESACRRAGLSGAFSYQSVKSILEKNLDQQPLVPLSFKSAGYHENVRGARYYSQAEMGAAL